MTSRLVISALPGETRAAWLEDDTLVDLVVQRADRPSQLGDIHHGRVAKVDKGLDAAFVEIGRDRPGLLPLSEAPGRRLSEGDAVVVKVLREAAPGKGPRLSGRIIDPPPGLDEMAGRTPPPALLIKGDDPLQRLLAAGRLPDEIVIDDPEAFAATKADLAGRAPAAIERLRLDLDPAPLFERAGIEAEVDALLEPRVALPSGGYLLIEPVRTLTAVDVNSGGHNERGGRGSGEDQALGVNLEAAAEIPRQLRLRALSGLVVVDFLALRDRAARKQVEATLRNGLKRDPEPARVFPMAASGLVEVTRRRGRPALFEVLTEPCGIGGTGRVKDPVTLAFEALRAVRREAAARPGAEVTVEAATAVVAALEEGPAAAARRALEESLGRAIGLTEVPRSPGKSAEIVLGSAR